MKEGRTFGECRCYHIKQNGTQTAVVRPERSRYPLDLIEVIAPVHLRRALGLEDGYTFRIEKGNNQVMKTVRAVVDLPGFGSGSHQSR